jgi:hypothetical protein
VVPFPPQPPRKVALPCPVGSPVLRRSPTSPARTCPPCGCVLFRWIRTIVLPQNVTGENVSAALKANVIGKGLSMCASIRQQPDQEMLAPHAVWSLMACRQHTFRNNGLNVRWQIFRRRAPLGSDATQRLSEWVGSALARPWFADRTTNGPLGSFSVGDLRAGSEGAMASPARGIFLLTAHHGGLSSLYSVPGTSLLPATTESAHPLSPACPRVKV